MSALNPHTHPMEGFKYLRTNLLCRDALRTGGHTNYGDCIGDLTRHVLRVPAKNAKKHGDMMSQ